jgi:ribosomal-protein-serine acetyltransferase
VEESRSCPGLPVADEIRLRLLDESEASELQAAIAANRSHLARWLPWAAEQSQADSEEFIRGSYAQALANSGFHAAILQRETIAGMAGFSELDWERRSATVGYWLAEDWQGKGIATAAVGALVDHALAVWELDRVEIRVAAENRRSRAVPERLGFALEEGSPGTEPVGGRELELVMYSMTAGRWPSAAGEVP